jgi:hypothetical protein
MLQNHTDKAPVNSIICKRLIIINFSLILSTEATGTAIGTGQSNTDAINAECGKATAAYLAANYKWPNGKTGGFLPSKDELNELYKHKVIVDMQHVDMQHVVYWSSSEDNSSYAWLQLFSLGTKTWDQYFGNKYGTVLVRAVRAF